MEEIYRYLLKDKNNRATGQGLDGLPFQFGFWEHQAGFKVLTVYRDGKACKGQSGRIMWEAEIMAWMKEIKAEMSA